MADKYLQEEGKCPLFNPPGIISYRLYGTGQTKIVFQMGLNTTGEFYEFIVNIYSN